jgi:hypothetical protein
LKYDSSMHALRELLRPKIDEEDASESRVITKSSTMIHTSREGLGYYFVEVTGSNGRHYLIQAYGEEAKGLQKEVRSQEQD